MTKEEQKKMNELEKEVKKLTEERKEQDNNKLRNGFLYGGIVGGVSSFFETREGKETLKSVGKTAGNVTKSIADTYVKNAKATGKFVGDVSKKVADETVKGTKATIDTTIKAGIAYVKFSDNLVKGVKNTANKTIKGTLENVGNAALSASKNFDEKHNKTIKVKKEINAEKTSIKDSIKTSKIFEKVSKLPVAHKKIIEIEKKLKSNPKIDAQNEKLKIETNSLKKELENAKAKQNKQKKTNQNLTAKR